MLLTEELVIKNALGRNVICLVLLRIIWARWNEWIYFCLLLVEIDNVEWRIEDLCFICLQYNTSILNLYFLSRSRNLSRCCILYHIQIILSILNTPLVINVEPFIPTPIFNIPPPYRLCSICLSVHLSQALYTWLIQSCSSKFGANWWEYTLERHDLIRFRLCKLIFEVVSRGQKVTNWNNYCTQYCPKVSSDIDEMSSSYKWWKH